MVIKLNATITVLQNTQKFTVYYSVVILIYAYDILTTFLALNSSG